MLPEAIFNSAYHIPGQRLWWWVGLFPNCLQLAPRPQSILLLLVGAPSWMGLDQVSYLLPKAIGSFISSYHLLSLWGSSSWTFKASSMTSSSVDRLSASCCNQSVHPGRVVIRHFLWCMHREGMMLLSSLWGQRYCSTIWMSSKGKCTLKKSSIFFGNNETCIGEKMNPAIFKGGRILEAVSLTDLTLLSFPQVPIWAPSMMGIILLY